MSLNLFIRGAILGVKQLLSLFQRHNLFTCTRQVVGAQGKLSETVEC